MYPAWFSLPRSCGGIAPGFAPTGAGNRGVGSGDPGAAASFVNSFRISKENPLWGAPRIHGELLKLGYEVAESTVSKYMIRRRGPPSQSWRTFLRNHADAIAAIDLCVVPTVTFERLFAFLVMGHGRRRLLWFAVTRRPTAEWLARQIVEAFPWDTAPSYLVRDNDRAYGEVFTRRVRTMGIRDRPIAPGSPWQNPYVERLIGTVRRDCLDHLLIFGEPHLRRVLTAYSHYYNGTRTHLGLGKDARTGEPSSESGSLSQSPSSLRTDMIFGRDKPCGRGLSREGHHAGWKVKNPAAPAVTRKAKEGWNQRDFHDRYFSPPH
jgi:transposase InsO family protein